VTTRAEEPSKPHERQRVLAEFLRVDCAGGAPIAELRLHLLDELPSFRATKRGVDQIAGAPEGDGLFSSALGRRARAREGLSDFCS